MTGRPWRARAFLVALVTLGAFVHIGPPAHAATGTPSWWSGTCDATYWNAQAAARHWPGARAHPLGASYLGVPVCGPRPAVDGAPDILWRKAGWGELEFECVELAMRFMGQVYGVSAYNANGNSVVRNYTAADGGNLVKIDNGTVGVAPQPGDIISFDSPGLGHVGVVASTDVDAHGNGTIRMLSQNDTADGWRTLVVANWRVAAFGNQVPYGWLHDPAGRGGAGSNPASASGYWMLGSTGTVYGFGGARNFGSSSIVPAAFASRRQGDGYWIVDAAGRVVAYGAATVHGGPPKLRVGEQVSTIAATPSGNGYWLFTNLGRAFAYGDAHFYGDLSAYTLDGAIVAAVATPTGRGYDLVGRDGGVFSFGDARFHGSTGGMKLDQPVVGISPTPDNRGYWLVASDGGVFAFDAPFRGSMGGRRLNQPVNGLIAYGSGYLMVAADGGVFDFSDQPFAGSLGGAPPAAPIIGIAAFTK